MTEAAYNGPRSPRNPEAATGYRIDPDDLPKGE